MGWKNWPYWVRSGIIVMIVLAVVTFVTVILNLDNCAFMPKEQQPVICDITNVLVAPLAAIFYILTKTGLDGYPFFFLGVFLCLLLFFVVGSVVGWIIIRTKDKGIKSGRTKNAKDKR